MKEFKLDDVTHNGFKIPENYFDALPQKVMGRILESEPKVIPISSSRYHWILTAAAILILALAIPILNKFSVSDQLDAVAIENFLTYNASISQEDIIELLDSDDIEQINIDNLLEDQAVEDVLVSDTNLEHYIIN